MSLIGIFFVSLTKRYLFFMPKSYNYYEISFIERSFDREKKNKFCPLFSVIFETEWKIWLLKYSEFSALSENWKSTFKNIFFSRREIVFRHFHFNNMQENKIPYNIEKICNRLSNTVSWKIYFTAMSLHRDHPPAGESLKILKLLFLVW